MKELIQNFSAQLESALKIGKNYSFKTPKRDFSNIILTGLGGSGIGGSIVQNYTADKLSIPFLVNKDYLLPRFTGSDTLVIVSSYSGNTEETVAAMEQAIKAKATVICVTSGGKIAELAKKKGLDCILLPAGMPPRACLGYSLVQQLFILKHFGLLKTGFVKELEGAISLLRSDAKQLEQKGKKLAEKLQGRLPVIYSAAGIEGVAVRFRQQLNENSKLLCWHHVIPEMNHNELVGWRDKDEHKAVVILRSEDDYERAQLRMEINKKIIRKYTPNIIEVTSKGNNFWERAFYLIHLTDWASLYLAEFREVDATEVKVIDFLKGELSKN